MEIKLDNPHHESSVANIFASYFFKEDYVDVTFVCAGGKKVKGHKIILSVVSPLLKKMFSECSVNQDMIMVLVPDVDSNVLKLVLDFMYEGTAKLSETELDGFTAIQDMLEIRFPGVIINDCRTQEPPRILPLPILKNGIQPEHQNIALAHSGNGERQERDATAVTSLVDSHPPRRSGDTDDDPLNVPDCYFPPTNSSVVPQPQGATNGVGGCVPCIGNRQVVNGCTQKDDMKDAGVRKRPRSSVASDTKHSVDILSAVNSEQSKKKRAVKKRNKRARVTPFAGQSGSNVMDTGGVQTRKMQAKKT